MKTENNCIFTFRYFRRYSLQLDEFNCHSINLIENAMTRQNIVEPQLDAYTHFRTPNLLEQRICVKLSSSSSIFIPYSSAPHKSIGVCKCMCMCVCVCAAANNLQLAIM